MFINNKTTKMDKDIKITEDVQLVNKGDVFVMYLNTKENRFNPTFINKINDALDVVDKHPGAVALITYSTSPKIYSNGLDLDWAMKNSEKTDELAIDFIKLFARFLALPFVTIAAITGHAFAGGCLFACAHDYRIMSNSKGFICLPELDTVTRRNHPNFFKYKNYTFCNLDSI